MKIAVLNIKFIKHQMIDKDVENQTQLANLLEIPPRAVQEWFLPVNRRKAKMPSPKNLAKLIDFFECDFNDLLEVVEIQDERL